MKDELFDQIAEAVINGESQHVAELVHMALEENIPAGEILNDALIAGMNEVGVLFKEGEMFVPDVLVASKALQAGIEIVKPLLVAEDVKSIGRMVTVTVEGDLHDIGIKLCGLMLEGAGFEVINLGVDQSAKAIVEKVKDLVHGDRVQKSRTATRGSSAHTNATPLLFLLLTINAAF